MEFTEFVERYMSRPIYTLSHSQMIDTERAYQRYMRDEEESRMPNMMSSQRAHPMIYRDSDYMTPGIFSMYRGGRVEEKSENLKKYENRKLKEYASPKFDINGELLPKEMVPFAVMCPKDEISNRVKAYLV